LSFKQFGARKRTESKNETMELQARYFDQVLLPCFLLIKLKNIVFTTFNLPSTSQIKWNF